MKTSKNKTGTARLIELAATKKSFIVISIVLSSLAAIIGFVPFIAIYLIVSETLNSLPDMASLDSLLLIKYGWLAFAGVTGNILLYFAALCFSHLAAFGTLYELKVNFASHIAKLPLGFHVLTGSGKLRKIMDENIEKIEGFIAHQLPDIVAAFVAPVVMIVILLAVNWRFGIAALLGIIIAFVMQLSLYGNEGSKALMNKYQHSLEELNNASVEYIRGMSVVKAFKQTVYSFRRLHETIKSYTEMVIPYTLSWENSFSGFVTLVNNIYLFVIPAGILVGMKATDYFDFAGKLIFYLLFTPSIAAVLLKLMYVNGNIMRIIAGVEAMDEILGLPVLPQPQVPKQAAGFDINFDNVSFTYNKHKQKDALTGISFLAKQNEITAIVGPSGGGKSTIAHLIPRFFDVTEGKITIGGTDVREMTTSYLMDKVSFVFQDVFLFKQSVMDNIRMGNETISDTQVIAAAKAAQCHEFVEKLPNGYGTVIGTKGVHLSGGEKQRIAIARAIVKDTPIVVLDEATAFADPENEHLIQKAFKELMKDKTVIMIAHRLSTIRSADKIIVISEGKAIEQGNHNDLIKMDGKYNAMWQSYIETSSWSLSKNREVPMHA